MTVLLHLKAVWGVSLKLQVSLQEFRVKGSLNPKPYP